MKVQVDQTELQTLENREEEIKVTDASIAYRQRRVRHWNSVARWMDRGKGAGAAYHRRLASLYGFLVPKGMDVLELGCSEGDLLAALEPRVGVGVDFSAEMIERARQKHPDLRFVEADAHSLDLGEKFDIIILSDLVNDLWDVLKVLEQVARHSGPHTRVIFNLYSRVWELPLRLARWLGLAKPNLAQNWLTVEDVAGLLSLAGFEIVRHRKEVLLPLNIPLLASLANRYLAKLWPFNLAVLTHLIVAKPILTASDRAKEPTVSVIVPARNEAGNIAGIFSRVPALGSDTELIFVEGGSTDNTYEEIERAIAVYPGKRCLLLKQTGSGKGDAVRLGFGHASGDVLMILDSDLSVLPEDLTRFLNVLVSGKADFVNGSRLVYPMEKEAMRFLNLIGNKFFSFAFSWLLEQDIKDTLCGTKALWKSDYEEIVANRKYFGDFDPFGDFDLLFGAAKLNLKIIDLPIRYHDRTYGSTNIQRWRHGWLLMKMVAFAAGRIKFV
ncbi:MAG TPA: glycosyltransferase [Pyrinomonadaceae bacterium]|nr:glycosyltransferase [Pyrinomonadaceae bacterium]